MLTNRPWRYTAIAAAFPGFLLLSACTSGAGTAANAPPVFSSSAALVVPENTTAVIVVSATDADGQALSYSVTGGADQGDFSIDVGSGTLVFGNAPDVENPVDSDTDNVYLVEITASDGRAAAVQAMVITVTNVSDIAPVFTSGTTISVAENISAVMAVGATDAEGDSVSYTVSGGADSARFAVNAGSGLLSFATPPNFEAPTDSNSDNVYVVVITATDGINTDAQTVTVTVTDVSGEAPAFTSATARSLAENIAAVMTVRAVDDDGEAVAYSVTGGTDQSAFTIHATSGALNFVAAPDFEAPADSDADNIYVVQVTASAGGDAVVQTIVVTITDVDEVLPVFTSSATPSVVENTTAVVTVTATDAGGDPVTYLITGGADRARFSIDGSNGKLSFIVAPNYETPTDTGADNTYVVIVSASDGNNLVPQTITVSVTDVFDLGVADGGIKNLAFIWSAWAGATHYKLKVNPDGASGYTQVGSDIVGTAINVEIPVHLTNWPNASYVLEAHNGGGLIGTTPAVTIAGLMISSIGYIKAVDPGANDDFGLSIALSSDGTTLAVGVPGEDSGTTGIASTPDETAVDAGAVFVFRKSGTSWVQQAYVKASNAGAGDNFGHSVALGSAGNTLAVGAYWEDSGTTGINSTPNEGGSDSGAAYVFRYATGAWSEQAYIKASNAGPSDRFGWSVALSGDGNTLAVGASLEDSATVGVGSTPNESGPDSGAAYVFRYATGAWSEQAYVKASNAGASDRFGWSVALGSDGNTLAVGASLEDSATAGVGSTPNESGPDSGAAYVFRYATGAWSEQAYVKASNTGAGDGFGQSVSLNGDGNTLAVGAHGEDGSGTGINAVSNNNTANAGAVYVLRYTGSAWAEEAYIKSSNPGVGDLFGWSVALSGDGNTLAVGAYLEDSSTVGIASTPDESAANAGAAYVYRYATGAWSQRAYVKATITGAADWFGYSVSVRGDGDTLAAGARFEDGGSTGIDGVVNDDVSNAGAVYLY
ncbi:MAG: Uncharacterized protein FD165_1310 [Gammaproteobacteria bacterium]|nr:MAG: Uncharacterized protein FD165_1310 [Gammaproteobacteria bacterium]TND05809.1 MAG: alpha beta-propellor repeat-containing integrin [Gammaproteobacteria bacterium]